MSLPAVAAPTIPSETVRKSAAAALRAGATHYTDRAGILQVRETLAQWLGGVEPTRVIVTASGEEALFLALCGLFPRESVLVTAGLPSDRAKLLASLGLAAKEWFRTGPMPRGAAGLLAFAAELDGEFGPILTAASNAGLTTIVVESIARGEPLATVGVADQAVIVGDLDAAGLRHWGAGYVVGPSPLIEPLIDLKQGLNICTAGLAQHAAAAAAREAVRGRATALPRRTDPESWHTAPARPPASVSDGGTRQRYELLDLLAANPGAISLGRGDPDLPTPAPIVEAAVAAMARDVADLDPRGEPVLREAIADKLLRDNGVLVDPASEVLVTTGGQEAIFLLLQALLGPGDEILMPSPRYTSYDVAVNVAGARIVTVPPPGSLDFTLDPAAIEARITPRTRALLIISPGNPTAAVPSAASLQAVAGVARRHRLTIISDEMYERIVYGVQHTSVATLPGMRDLTVTVGGFSKAFAMTGWRVGYLAGPAPIVAAAAQLKELWSGPTSSISQAGALAALGSGDELWSEHLSIYRDRRALTLARLDDLGIRYAPSQGAFYGFFEIPLPGISSYDLSRRLLLEAGVFMYPGSGFGPEWSGHMRLAWLQPAERLEEALERFAGWLRGRR